MFIKFMLSEFFLYIKNVFNHLVKVLVIIDDRLKKFANIVHIDKMILEGIIVAAIFYLLYALGIVNIFIDIIGFFYPAYHSIKVIKNNNKDDRTQWLTYWLVFSLFKMFETAVGFLIDYFPFYLIFKAAYLSNLFMPPIYGAKELYNKIIKIFLVPHLGINEGTEESTD